MDLNVDTQDRPRHLPAGRKARLAAYVAEAGQVTVGALAERIGVSIDTIRRDLDQLSADGVLVRTYGGAVSRSTVSRVDRAVVGGSICRTRRTDCELARPWRGGHDMINGGRPHSPFPHPPSHRDLTVATNNLPCHGVVASTIGI